jgi:hypothetical protein
MPSITTTASALSSNSPIGFTTTTITPGLNPTQTFSRVEQHQMRVKLAQQAQQANNVPGTPRSLSAFHAQNGGVFSPLAMRPSVVSTGSQSILAQGAMYSNPNNTIINSKSTANTPVTPLISSNQPMKRYPTMLSLQTDHSQSSSNEIPLSIHSQGSLNGLATPPIEETFTMKPNPLYNPSQASLLSPRTQLTLEISSSDDDDDDDVIDHGEVGENKSASVSSKPEVTPDMHLLFKSPNPVRIGARSVSTLSTNGYRGENRHHSSISTLATNNNHSNNFPPDNSTKHDVSRANPVRPSVQGSSTSNHPEQGKTKQPRVDEKKEFDANAYFSSRCILDIPSSIDHSLWRALAKSIYGSEQSYEIMKEAVSEYLLISSHPTIVEFREAFLAQSDYASTPSTIFNKVNTGVMYAEDVNTYYQAGKSTPTPVVPVEKKKRKNSDDDLPMLNRHIIPPSVSKYTTIVSTSPITNVNNTIAREKERRREEREKLERKNAEKERIEDERKFREREEKERQLEEDAIRYDRILRRERVGRQPLYDREAEKQKEKLERQRLMLKEEAAISKHLPHPLDQPNFTPLHLTNHVEEKCPHDIMITEPIYHDTPIATPSNPNLNGPLLEFGPKRSLGQNPPSKPSIPAASHIDLGSNYAESSPGSTTQRRSASQPNTAIIITNPTVNSYMPHVDIHSLQFAPPDTQRLLISSEKTILLSTTHSSKNPTATIITHPNGSTVTISQENQGIIHHMELAKATYQNLRSTFLVPLRQSILSFVSLQIPLFSTTINPLQSTDLGIVLKQLLTPTPTFKSPQSLLNPISILKIILFAVAELYQISSIEIYSLTSRQKQMLRQHWTYKNTTKSVNKSLSNQASLANQKEKGNKNNKNNNYNNYNNHEEFKKKVIAPYTEPTFSTLAEFHCEEFLTVLPTPDELEANINSDNDRDRNSGGNRTSGGSSMYEYCLRNKPNLGNSLIIESDDERDDENNNNTNDGKNKKNSILAREFLLQNNILLTPFECFFKVDKQLSKPIFTTSYSRGSVLFNRLKSIEPPSNIINLMNQYVKHIRQVKIVRNENKKFQQMQMKKKDEHKNRKKDIYDIYDISSPYDNHPIDRKESTELLSLFNTPLLLERDDPYVTLYHEFLFIRLTQEILSTILKFPILNQTLFQTVDKKKKTRDEKYHKNIINYGPTRALYQPPNVQIQPNPQLLPLVDDVLSSLQYTQTVASQNHIISYTTDVHYQPPVEQPQSVNNIIQFPLHDQTGEFLRSSSFSSQTSAKSNGIGLNLGDNNTDNNDNNNNNNSAVNNDILGKKPIVPRKPPGFGDRRGVSGIGLQLQPRIEGYQHPARNAPLIEPGLQSGPLLPLTSSHNFPKLNLSQPQTGLAVAIIDQPISNHSPHASSITNPFGSPLIGSFPNLPPLAPLCLDVNPSHNTNRSLSTTQSVGFFDQTSPKSTTTNTYQPVFTKTGPVLGTANNRPLYTQDPDSHNRTRPQTKPIQKQIGKQTSALIDKLTAHHAAENLSGYTASFYTVDPNSSTIPDGFSNQSNQTGTNYLQAEVDGHQTTVAYNASIGVHPLGTLGMREVDRALGSEKRGVFSKRDVSPPPPPVYEMVENIDYVDRDPEDVFAVPFSIDVSIPLLSSFIPPTLPTMIHSKQTLTEPHQLINPIISIDDVPNIITATAQRSLCEDFLTHNIDKRGQKRKIIRHLDDNDHVGGDDDDDDDDDDRRVDDVDDDINNLIPVHHNIKNSSFGQTGRNGIDNTDNHQIDTTNKYYSKKLQNHQEKLQKTLLSQRQPDRPQRPRSLYSSKKNRIDNDSDDDVDPEDADPNRAGPIRLVVLHELDFFAHNCPYLSQPTDESRNNIIFAPLIQLNQVGVLHNDNLKINYAEVIKTITTDFHQHQNKTTSTHPISPSHSQPTTPTSNTNPLKPVKAGKGRSVFNFGSNDSAGSAVHNNTALSPQNLTNPSPQASNHPPTPSSRAFGFVSRLRSPTNANNKDIKSTQGTTMNHISNSTYQANLGHILGYFANKRVKNKSVMLPIPGVYESLVIAFTSYLNSLSYQKND